MPWFNDQILRMFATQVFCGFWMAFVVLKLGHLCAARGEQEEPWRLVSILATPVLTTKSFTPHDKSQTCIS